MKCRASISKSSRHVYSDCFALPTVLIASIIMLSVLISTVVTTTASRVALTDQRYNQLSKLASEAGETYAKACLDANNGISRWTETSPLKPSTDCTGTTLSGVSCPSDALCAVSSNNNDSIKATFSIGIKESSPPNEWKQVSAGYEHACAISSDDQIYCWGKNGFGQLGDGTTNNAHIPKKVNTANLVSGYKSFKYVSAAEFHTCAISTDDKAYCWGANFVGQLGVNSKVDKLIPTAIDTTNLTTGFKTVKKIDAGDEGGCVIATDDIAFCWGYNDDGEIGDNSTTQRLLPTAVDTTNLNTGYKTFKSISSGDGTACGIASDNAGFCWGGNWNGQLGDATEVNKLIPVAVDTTNLTTGYKTFKSIYTKDWTSCGVASDDKGFCWGSAYLGNGTTNQSNIPVAIDTTNLSTGNKTFISLSVLADNGCGVASDNRAFCWGDNSMGQIGDNSTSERQSPAEVSTTNLSTGFKSFNSIAMGGRFACGIATDSKLFCWGDNSDYYLGNNSTDSSLIPVSVNTIGVYVENIKVSSATNMLRLSDDTTWRTYANYSNMNIRYNVPERLEGATIETGGDTSCALSGSSEAYCWGSNSVGEIGDNSISNKTTAVKVNTSNLTVGNKTFISISSSGGNSCGVAADYKAFCWGDNYSGQVGDNSTTTRLVPTAVDTTNLTVGNKTFKSISVGQGHVCGVAADDKAFCWGLNDQGQLGVNSITDSHIPVEVNTTNLTTGYKSFKSIAAGSGYTCAIAYDDKAFCWGDYNYYNLGNNYSSDVLIPSAVDTTNLTTGYKTFKSISVDEYHTCGIATDDKAFCWGDNSHGELGDNSTDSSVLPIEVDTTNLTVGYKTFKSISVGDHHTCAVAADDRGFCWGYNYEGSIGDGYGSDRYIPTAVDTTNLTVGYKTFKHISTGSYYSCGLSMDNKFYCWGDNYYGQGGDGSTSSKKIPTQVNKFIFTSKNY